MRSLNFRLLAVSILGASLMFAPPANAEPLHVAGFFVGSQTINLTDPDRNGNVSAGAFILNPPAGEIAYCIDLRQFVNFNDPTYTDYTKSALKLDSVFGQAQKNELAQLYHGFYSASLADSIHSAAFQLAIWEIAFETSGTLDVDGAHSGKGVNFATGPDGPGSVIGIANGWLSGLNGGLWTDTMGLYTYRSDSHQDQIVYHRTPAPATWMILGAGLGLIAFLRRRRVNS